MKVLLTADVKYGALNSDNLNVKQAREWQAERMKKLGQLLNTAAKHEVDCVIFIGQLFGSDLVTNKTIDSLFHIVGSFPKLSVLTLFLESEQKHIVNRTDIPENFRIIPLQNRGIYKADDLSLRFSQEHIELKSFDGQNISISNLHDQYGVGFDGSNIIPSFEPMGFEDAFGSKQFGYMILHVDDLDGKWTSEIIESSQYQYRTESLAILPEDDTAAIENRIAEMTKRLDRNTFLRLFITGKSPFGIYISCEALKESIQKHIFYADVSDDSQMDAEEETLKYDISLKAEFVRLTLQDDSLSNSEKKHIISIGVNALEESDR